MSAAFWAAIGVAVLVVPPVIAWRRDVPGAGAILTLTVLGGWTVVGWVFALIWACLAPGRSEAAAQRAMMERLSGTPVRPPVVAADAAAAHSGIGLVVHSR